ncbi:MAG: ferredoxin-type protein NapF [Mariprofundales bacterium]|nr:ferredoxin-type protein NapF [Mariprofundales bacterium]
MTRRQLFTSLGRGGSMPLRPPWSLAEEQFQDECTRCGDCISSCPEGILQRESPNGYPVVNFTLGECTFCQQCVASCPSSALTLSTPEVWLAKVHITKRCLTLHGVICTTCAEQCEAGAISFTPAVGAVSQPDVDLDACTACGACVAPCPAEAMEVR